MPILRSMFNSAVDDRQRVDWRTWANSVLPIFIAFVLGAKQFMSGLTAGAIRG